MEMFFKFKTICYNCYFDGLAFGFKLLKKRKKYHIKFEAPLGSFST